MEMNILDSPGQPLSGFSWDAFLGGVPEQDRFGYLHYGTEHQIVLPVFRDNRVILFRTMLEAVDGADHEIPFTSLPRLGGPDRLRGYELDTFRDKKVVLGTLEYHYPIHQYVLGQLFAETGSLGRSYDDLFRKWNTGYGFGFLLGSKDDLKVKLDFSFGDGYHFFISLNQTKAFYQRRRSL
jgi:outer membrane protein assembly factor BamA